MSGETVSENAGGALRGRLAGLRERVAGLVERRSADDPTAADPLRGLYVTPETARRLAAQTPAEGTGTSYTAGGAHAGEPADEAPGPSDRSVALAGRFGLSALDLQILLAALAPDVDRSFEPLYGYLNDDVGRRRATVALALDLAGTGPYEAEARARFHPAAPLLSGGLLVIEDEDRPLPGRALRVPERVVAHLLGDNGLDPELSGGEVELLSAGQRAAGIAGSAAPTDDASFAGRLAALASGRPLAVHLRERRPGTAAEPVTDGLRHAGLPVLRYRPDGHHGDGAGLAGALLREARLRGAAVVVGPLPERPGALVRALAGGDVPVVLFGSEPHDPGWAPDSGLFALDAPDGGAAADEVWSTALGSVDEGFDLAAAVAPYRLGAAQIRRAARAATALAAFDGTPVTAAHVQHSARQQSAPLLDRHARRVRPAVGFDGLVLPPEPLSLLHELVQRARHREKVLGTWRLRTGGGRGRGVVALFAGESGTGKTLSAEVVAGALGLDLYVVELSSVVDKYIGETEKNLERIFSEADRTDAVLLFDEADAVFGKRSEVKSSHDRYANLESAYLLQRLEAFDGIAVLTTNLRANIDEAFTRRLDLVVDFPFPDDGQRLALWRSCLAATPCADDLGLDVCAKEFELSGGAIRSAAVTAGYLAAGRGGPVTAADVRAGARREYRKMGRLVPDASPMWD
ncbi:ATP-binding protein [Streptomyces sp. Je 1-4]|uniref:ATP-binding protein n=1 Tax=Streptomyces TaxID=1883 RepID=UPI0021DA6983|nr:MULTISPECIES: ATP-binding protein [unclassified Streptomyces]UYB43617.1 ATP-binding protein [Streptomyces sp. Je 1-4]UZQ40010.1 ATP-binding protein [Streptomyces sp. Je 1-4] [Streptomyces sp. Je 1-4 4N24]UZQ47427.1 ATP-binding protein [Streptomyces sp. Je 1-4] [Streptomyces sp. Je 1-4 4N24_ara]